MDLVGGSGILSGPCRVIAAMVVAPGQCGGVAAAVPWFSLSLCSWLALTVGPHHTAYVAFVAGPGLTPLVVVPV